MRWVWPSFAEAQQSEGGRGDGAAVECAWACPMEQRSAATEAASAAATLSSAGSGGTGSLAHCKVASGELVLEVLPRVSEARRDLGTGSHLPCNPNVPSMELPKELCGTTNGSSGVVLGREGRGRQK
mmetsp:Transcript_84072/g.272092  ORF Transcript_84072/g.272092 Transcript_84072/m.272092 type:complete len:127 (+) Transcript_84072:213-593(+)